MQPILACKQENGGVLENDVWELGERHNRFRQTAQIGANLSFGPLVGEQR